MSDHPQIEATDLNRSGPSRSRLGPRTIVGAIAALKFLLHMLTAAKYGLFTDELYFMACGEHLAWGYVDMPPLTAVQAWLARTLLGDSPYAIHFLPALAGAALVLMTGAMARQLGGGRWAQAVAALAAAIAPGCLAFDAYLSMNSIDLVLVAGLAMILIRIVNTGDLRLWLAFGVIAGIGLLNKHTIILALGYTPPPTAWAHGHTWRWRFACRHSNGALLSLLRWRLDRGMRESPEHMDELFNHMVWTGMNSFDVESPVGKRRNAQL